MHTRCGGGEVSIPGWILNTNTVTIALWINPSANPANSAGLVMCRGSQVGGICFGNNVTNGVYPLGINWNNEAASYNWNSGLTVPLNLWSFVAMAVSPTNTILYLINTNGLSSATITRNNVVVSFNGTIQIGNDTAGGGNRGFSGSIDDVAIFNSTLSQAQLLNLYAGASGVAYFPVTITAQPLPQTFFATGAVAHFSVAASGTPPLTYQWYLGATPLTNSSRISGATNATLTIGNLSAADLGNYHVVVANLANSISSSNALLSLQAPSGDPYEAGVLALSPMAFYELNETGDPASGNTLAFDYAGGYNGLYGTTVQNGNPNYNIQGPQPASGFPGFTAANTAAQFEHAAGSQITLPPFNLSTNNPLAVTMAAWIYPTASEPSNAGLVFSRANGSVCGLDYSSALDASGNRTLGYMWNNNDPNTYNWSSWLVPPQDQWSLVALTVSPTNAILYLLNTNSFYSCAHVYNHVPQQFPGSTLIGDDSYDGGNGGRAFVGTIDDVAVFNRILSSDQVVGLFAVAAGISNFPPTIAAPPASTNAYQMQAVRMTVLAGGTPPLAYQWMAGPSGQGVFTNLADNGRIVDSAAATLIISNVDFPDAADYVVVISNAYGAVTSTPPATLTVSPVGPPLDLTLAGQEAVGLDWNTTAQWSDGNAASVSAVQNPGSTYEVLANARLRTPITGPATFPGNVLTIDGDGVFVANGSPTIGELRFKATPMTFPRLVMRGGQVDTSNGGGAGSTPVAINGTMVIQANTPFYNDSSDDEGYVINACLTGAGSIEYHDLGYSLVNGNTLNITCPTNAYSGTWNIVLGTLLGSGTNSLGTNTITVGATGALETTYDIDNPSGDLILNGQMLLHQNDTFRTVRIGGFYLAPGTHSYAQLAAAHPANFPATWASQKGSAVTSASGSLTALAAPAPVTITFQRNGSSLQLTWPQGSLLQATNLAGPWTLVTGAASPYTLTVSPTTPALFFRAQE